jgi:hypothetical protein
MGDWVSDCDRIKRWLAAVRPRITHTIERIIDETQTVDEPVHGRGLSFWQQLAAGAPAYETAVRRGISATALVDENNHVAAVR